jgi:hypothetical protein
MARYSAIIVFDDKEKDPILVGGLESDNPEIVRGKINEMFAGGYVRIDGVFEEKETKKQKVAVISKYFALEEIDHIDIVETVEIPQESEEVIAERKAREKAEKKKAGK